MDEISENSTKKQNEHMIAEMSSKKLLVSYFKKKKLKLDIKK